MFTTRTLLLLTAAISTYGVYGAKFVGCVSEKPSDPIKTVNADPFEACRTACGGFGFAYSFTETPSHLGVDTSCSCTNSISNIDWVASNSNTCPEGDYTIHDISAKTKRQLNKRQASNPESSTDPNVVKRKEQLVKEKRRDPRDLCPTEMVACKVQGVDAYECLDVSSELESCGGCMYGLYLQPAKGKPVTQGVDCSTLPGTALGAVTCSAGHCVAEACKRGWLLQDEGCVKARIVEARRSRL